METMVQLKNNLYLPAPNVTLDYVKNRGFSVFGMSKMAYMYTSLTLGLEYVWNVALRIYKIYDRMGRFGCRITTRSEFYQAMINSSMICWMNLETGHLEFRNVRLAYKNDEIVDIPYCCIELDHEVKSTCNFTRYLSLWKKLSIEDWVLCKRGLEKDNSYLKFLSNSRKRKLYIF